MKLLKVVLVLFTMLCYTIGASMDKPHSHGGVLEPYSGEPLPVQLTADQRVKLEKGESVRTSHENIIGTNELIV